MSSARDRDLTARLDRLPFAALPGAPRLLGRVVDGGAMGTTPDRYYLVQPVIPGGSEQEGASGSFADAGELVPVVFLGSRPLAGERHVAHFVGNRWVAETGKDEEEPCEGLHTLVVLNCCGGDQLTSSPAFSVTKGGVAVASGVVTTSRVVFPKSKGAGAYVVVIAGGECQGKTVTINIAEEDLCVETNTTTVLAQWNTGWICCGPAKSLPRAIKLVDAMGVHSPRDGSLWSWAAHGPAANVDRPEITNLVEWFEVVDLSARACFVGTWPANCDKKFIAHNETFLDANTAEGYVDYNISCEPGVAPGSTKLTLEASWWYNEHVAQNGLGGACNRCSDPVLGGDPVCPEGCGCDAEGTVTMGADCQWVDPPASWQQLQRWYTPWPSITGIKVTAYATWEGVLTNPTSLSVTFNLAGSFGAIDGPRVFAPGSIVPLPPPPPPGGTTITAIFP